MKRKLEVELKFAVLDAKQVNEFLARKKFVAEKRIVDVYLDTSLAALFKRGIFIRIRDGKKLDFKFNTAHFAHHGLDNAHDHCDEYSFLLPLTKKDLVKANRVCGLLALRPINRPTIEALKTANLLIESMVIDKTRRIYRDARFEYSLDRVKGLGVYLEIENLKPVVKSVSEMTRLMLAELKNLELKHVNVGYNELYWRKHDFEIYKQGLYLLKEDFKKLSGRNQLS